MMLPNLREEGNSQQKCAKKRLLLGQHVSYLVYGSNLPMEGALQVSRKVSTLVNQKIQFPIQTERNTQRLNTHNERKGIEKIP